MIRVEKLSKDFRVPTREGGLRAALKSVFRRRYRDVHALAGISFAIAEGKRVGFLGPNGAGKTTTLKLLAGLLTPTSGTVEVSGFVPNQRRREFLASIMLVTGQKNQLLWDLPPVDTFDLNRAIYDVPLPEYRRRLDELVTTLEIGEVMKRPTRQLSLGERMKCELCAALVHGPRLLFLDEPTIGLDVTMQATVRHFIETYSERHGATVLLTSHNMNDVAALCDRVLIINHGRLYWDGALPELVRRTRPEKWLTLVLAAPVAAATLAGLGRVVERDDRRAVLQVTQAELRSTVERALRDIPVADLTVSDAPLEEVLADVFASTAGSAP
jgi:ABC-2 type transport system ATP-binding protein